MTSKDFFNNRLRPVRNSWTYTTTTIHYKKERRPTALRREKREEHLDTEGHQGEGAGEKEETDWEEAEGKEREVGSIFFSW
jgi:hypothetical protein